jgi:DnaJ-class molecular chaperone
MQKKTKIVKQKTKEESMSCLFGTCPSCTYTDQDGRGIHVVEYYDLIQVVLCDKCDGKGVVIQECMECDGTGTIEEDCDCDAGVDDDAEDSPKIIGKETKVKAGKGVANAVQMPT